MASSALTHYEVLEAPVGAPFETLKENYRRLSLALHPDHNARDPGAAHEAFCRLQRAWEVLREAKTRQAYDRELVTAEEDDASSVDVWMDVPAERLARAADDDAARTFECHCGGIFVVALDELRAGYDVVPCDGCSRTIRVVLTRRDPSEEV